MAAGAQPCSAQTALCTPQLAPTLTLRPILWHHAARLLPFPLLPCPLQTQLCASPAQCPALLSGHAPCPHPPPLHCSPLRCKLSMLELWKAFFGQKWLQQVNLPPPHCSPPCSNSPEKSCLGRRVSEGSTHLHHIAPCLVQALQKVPFGQDGRRRLGPRQQPAAIAATRSAASARHRHGGPDEPIIVALVGHQVPHVEDPLQMVSARVIRKGERRGLKSQLNMGAGSAECSHRRGAGRAPAARS